MMRFDFYVHFSRLRYPRCDASGIFLRQIHKTEEVSLKQMLMHYLKGELNYE